MDNGTPLKTVLLVEDEPALQEAVRLKLGKAGVKVLVASNGEQALATLAQTKPSLVWLDILLPGINGLEVLRKIREDKILKALPVVVVSVSGGQEKIKQAFSMNIVDYIVKSEYTIDDIVGKIKDILSSLS